MKIKVLHIITRLDAGGSATNTLETVARLDPDLYAVQLISGRTYDPDGSIKDFIEDNKIDCIFLEALGRSIHPWQDIKALWQLYRLIRQGGFDIVHTHSSKAGILGRWAAWLAGVRHIVHTPHGHVFYGYYGKFISQLFIMIEQITSRISDKIITLTDIGKAEHVKWKIAKEAKFTTIYSGVEWQKFEPDYNRMAQYRQQFDIPEGAFVFGSVARLEPVKGHVYLIEAMVKVAAKFPDTKLVLVGEGALRKELEEKCRVLNLESRVIFTGHQADVTNWIHLMDVFMLGSLNEGMGRVILEAMACERPVIASRTGGIPELVVEGQTGLLVKPGDTDGLAEAMIHLYENRREVKVFGIEGKSLVTHIFSMDKMIEDIEGLYQELG